ncbi:hypothetical protein F5884DRAFT_218951 [Xylogone sp. PMI_703]|nr:hypothetical protein F5884DRAFT_218951 [Xylogone sp. PMI_703]
MTSQRASKPLRLVSSIASLRSHRKNDNRDYSPYSPVTKINTDRRVSAQSSTPGTPYQGYIENRTSPFEFERTNDIVGIQDGSKHQRPVFEVLVPSSYQNEYESGFFVLPASVRKQIYSECFSLESRKISLSPPFATTGVFPNNYFASPWEVLAPVLGGLHSCAVLRHELMAYFWMHYHFHVTLSIFTGPVFSPLTSTWLVENIDLIQHLTIEIDLTRLDGNCINLRTKPNGSKVDQLLVTLINGISTSHKVSKMAELNLMCRRYFRFGSSGKFEIEDIFNYPDENQYLHDAVFQLRGIVQKSRVSGFSFRYSRMLLNALFGEGHNRPKYIYPPESPWPVIGTSPATPLNICPTPCFTTLTGPSSSGVFETPRSVSTFDTGKSNTSESSAARNRVHF